MMEVLRKFSIDNDIECYLALETIMACGIGICQGCTIVKKSKCSDDSYRNKFVLACMDGPVFNLENLEYDYI